MKHRLQFFLLALFFYSPCVQAMEEPLDNLFQAIADKRYSDIARFIGNPCNRSKIDGQDRQGCTPLMKAVAMGNKDIVDMLLCAGANPNIPEAGLLNSPLHVAANLQKEPFEGSIVELLFNFGADVTAVNQHWKTKRPYQTPDKVAWNPEVASILKNSREAVEHAQANNQSMHVMK